MGPGAPRRVHIGTAGNAVFGTLLTATSVRHVVETPRPKTAHLHEAPSTVVTTRSELDHGADGTRSGIGHIDPAAGSDGAAPLRTSS
jgi:hypothetical protein